ncbi:hypothetical protein [Arcanobacterium hippocoleae]|uniref:hypothetical protein n=1 Tax=Arcanobacterium hippocoleae TaxID=149017 RepID=UPI0033400E19
MMIDVNAHLSFAGTGEKLVRSYSVRCDEDSDKTITLHDADAFQVSRDFDLSVKNLTVESSKDKLDTKSKTKTNYVINAIMPFDTENCVRFDANYLRGYTSEKRDTNVANLKPIVHTQVTDIARYEANKTIAEYDRGVAWEEENLTVKGDSWTTAYLPVWIYSYMQVKRKRKILHYVAVNARTKETMGSVPLNYRRLIFFTFWLWLSGLGFVPFLHEEYRMLSFVPCIAFFIFMFRKYRNLGARHEYEKETYREVRNIVPIDRFLEHRTELSETRIEGANNHAMKGFTERFTISDTLEEMVKMGEKYNGIQEKLYTRKEEWLSKRKRN